MATGGTSQEKVFELTARERVVRDRKFCEQIQESARSAPANMAEGFGRYDAQPNAHYVSIAKASLDGNPRNLKNPWNPLSDSYSRANAPGSSTSSFTRTRKRTASAPSTIRWS
jgi:hypothetical protein